MGGVAVFFVMQTCANAALHEMFPQEDPAQKGAMVILGAEGEEGGAVVRSRSAVLPKAQALPVAQDKTVYPFFADAAYTTTVTRVAQGFGSTEIVEGTDAGTGIKSLSVYSEEGVRHEIRNTENGHVYIAVSRADGTLHMQEFDPAAEPGCCGTDDSYNAPHENIMAELAGGFAPLAAGDTEIDLLMVFDKNAAAWSHSHAGGVIAIANSAVSRMNTALEDSGIACTIRLVGVYLPDYMSSPYVSNALSDLDKGSGGLSGVAAQRTAVGADVVSIMIDTATGTGTAGVAYLGGGASMALSACAIRFVNTGHVMTHEIGHNFGCGHSKTQDIQTLKVG